MNENVSTWDSRMQAASKIMGFEKAEDFEANFTSVTGITRELGVAALDSEDFKFGDFRESYKDKPVPLVRMVYTALKGGKASDKAPLTGPEDPRLQQLREAGYKVKFTDAPTPWLLQMYIADRPNDPITQALKTRFGTKAVIAFNDDGTINVAATVEYTSGVEQGFPESETVNVNGRLVKLWPVGVKPDVLVDEDPLVPGSPLRNGVSVVNHRNWSKVEHPQRQFCRLVLEHGDIDADNHEAVLRLLERAQAGTLAEAYPEVDLLFRDKQKRDELPKLRVQLGQNTRPQNPFGVKRSY